MNLKITCIVLVCITTVLVHSKSIGKKLKHASKSEKEANKRISTQQKIGSGHAKGPMANNVQGSVPLPVVMPFPMIPFDEKYPILVTPNGKPKKGRQKKKDPKGETEDETDKDVDDENNDGDKEYKAIKPGKVDTGSQSGSKLAKGATKADDEDDGGDESQSEAAQTAHNQLKVLLQENGKVENDEVDEADDEDDNERTEEDKKEYENDKEQENDEEEGTEDPEKDEDEGSEETGNEEENEEDKLTNNEDNEDESKQESKVKTKSRKTRNAFTTARNARSTAQSMRERRSIYKPIIGNPEDIMPYIMLGTEEQEVIDGKNAHQVATRDVAEEYSPSQQIEFEDYDAPHDIHTRDVEEDSDDNDDDSHVIATREVNAEEEDEEEARDMKPRSLPDENPDLDTAEKKLKDTQLAADVLTQIQKALGANPETSIEETHSLADFLRKNMEEYDQKIAKDILATQNAQTRSKVIVNDDGNKENAELANAKRKLEDDRTKEREIQQELKELKDIELMTTELELAKYLATENARHQVQFARAMTSTRAPAPPQPASQHIEYAPITYQQPAMTYAPVMDQQPVVMAQPVVMSQPAVIATPWQQNMYPQAVSYAYGSSHAGPVGFRNEMDNSINMYNIHRYEASRTPEASLARPASFQQAIETPRPSFAVHTEAQSRHITKPKITKPQQYKTMRPFGTKFYPKPRPYTQSRVSNGQREHAASSLIGGKPTIIFPGPTYSPPPLMTREGRPKNRKAKTGYKSYSNRYSQTKQPSNPALKSFFTQQHQIPQVNNMYQNPTFLAQQHGPIFTEEVYSIPMATPVNYHVGAYHSVEKEQPRYDLHAPFSSPVHENFGGYHSFESSLQHVNPWEQSPSKAQIPASNTQFASMQSTDYIGTQHGVPNQYALPRPQGPSYGAPPQVIYQAPASYAETMASSKGGIPSIYAPYYAMPQQIAPSQFINYAQTAQPFETMNTDSEAFQGKVPPQSKAPNAKGNAKEQEDVPLGYGLYPLPENAESKMEDKEEQQINEKIKNDTEKLNETKQAAMAVTKIENKVGFDPGSIAKLVDFVKQAAEKDVSLSERAMKRDQMTIKKMEIEHVNDKKSEISNDTNIAMKEAEEKLKIDSELLRESKDRLEKVKKMEMIVTGIEAAKFSALSRKQAKLEEDVQKMHNYQAAKKTVVGRKGLGKRAS